jgi:FkbM family methyltransferase
LIPFSFLISIHRFTKFAIGIGTGAGTASHEGRSITALLKTMKLHDREIYIFDIGSAFGVWTQGFLDSIDRPSQRKVVAFLFDPIMKPEIDFDKYNYQNIEINYEELAISSVDSLLLIDPISSSAHPYKVGSQSIKMTEVSSISFDSFLNSRSLIKSNNSIWIMKLDIEGHEVDVLLGAKLALDHIDIIQFEIGPFWIEANRHLFDFTKHLSMFTLGIISLQGGVKLLGDYSTYWEIFETTNLVAIRKSLLEEN